MKVLGSLLIFLNIIFANDLIDIYLDKKVYALGEDARLIIEIKNPDISIQDLDSIDEFRIEGRSKSSSIQIVNGKTSSSIKYIYTFKPSKDFVVEPIKYTLDGKEYLTKSLEAKVSKTKNYVNKDFSLELKTDKKEAYVGESLRVKLIYKIRKGLRTNGSEFKAPKAKNLWKKASFEETPKDNGAFSSQVINYIFTPQKVGIASLSPARLDIALIEDNLNFFSYKNIIKTAISNALELKIKPLPKDINLSGEFKIKTYLDKEKLDANKALNFKIDIFSNGNIEDIPKIDLKIKDAMIYAEKPKIKHNFDNGIYQGRYTINFAIIADRNFTIPAIKIKYFDLKDKKIKTLSTEEKKIEVIESIKSSIEKSKEEETKRTTKKEKKVEGSSYKELIIATILGVILGFTIPILLKLKGLKRKGFFKIDDKDLLNEALAFSKDEEIKEEIEKLNENVFNKGMNNINYKKIKTRLKELKNKGSKLP